MFVRRQTLLYSQAETLLMQTFWLSIYKLWWVDFFCIKKLDKTNSELVWIVKCCHTMLSISNDPLLSRFVDIIGLFGAVNDKQSMTCRWWRLQATLIGRSKSSLISNSNSHPLPVQRITPLKNFNESITFFDSNVMQMFLSLNLEKSLTTK